uniref:Putative rop guanine nucleotide exchange factor 12 n=1 Tax=Lupinus angustifolius TaxID=3871 RepID=A0A182BFA2_LUPAN|nr:putative rop guanine nucleotide exchange factor 12 [Lupinus angustifolius]
MVQAGEQEQEGYRSKLFNFRGMFESTGRHTKSLSIESATILDPTSPIEDGSASSKTKDQMFLRQEL